MLDWHCDHVTAQVTAVKMSQGDQKFVMSKWDDKQDFSVIWDVNWCKNVILENRIFLSTLQSEIIHNKK